MTPRENFAFINAYLCRMEPIIREYNGFIDKYIGDAIMALFPSGVDDALCAAINMLRQLNEYNQESAASKGTPISIGIGLNTGHRGRHPAHGRHRDQRRGEHGTPRGGYDQGLRRGVADHREQLRAAQGPGAVQHPLHRPRAAQGQVRAGDRLRGLLQQQIRAYYRGSQLLYDLLWSDPHSLSMNYGFWRRDTHGLQQALVNQHQEVARLLQPGPQDQVLDAGCGVGGTGIWIARRFGCQVTGITLSEMQVERAQRNANRKGVSRLTRFLARDYTRTGCPDVSFSRIFANESVCYATDKADFAREVHRLLVPGGRLVVGDGFLTDRTLSASEQRTYRSWLQSWAIPNLASVDGFRHALQDAGFGQVEYHDRTPHVMPSARRILALGLWPIPRCGCCVAPAMIHSPCWSTRWGACINTGSFRGPWASTGCSWPAAESQGPYRSWSSTVRPSKRLASKTEKTWARGGMAGLAPGLDQLLASQRAGAYITPVLRYFWSSLCTTLVSRLPGIDGEPYLEKMA